MKPSFHLSLNVGNLERSVNFYATLLGVEPAKSYVDYAKFEVDDPAITLALQPGPIGGGSLNHLGLRVQDGEGLRAAFQRLATKGFETQFMSDVECCYARQSKIVTCDPDGTMVEVYVHQGDVETKAPSNSTKMAAAPQVATAETLRFEHLLGTPFALPESNEQTLYDELHLRGTFNDPAAASERHKILKMALNSLKPGATLSVHLLVADKALTQELPQLPAPANYVRHVPLENEIMQAIEQAGFNSITLKRFSHEPVFRFDGVNMRELLVEAKRPYRVGAEALRTVVYRGPFKTVTDDMGHTYRRGERIPVADLNLVIWAETNQSDALVVLTDNGPRSCEQ